MRRALILAAVATFSAAGSGIAWAQSPPPHTTPPFLDKKTPPAQVAPVVVAVPAFTG